MVRIPSGVPPPRHLLADTGSSRQHVAGATRAMPGRRESARTARNCHALPGNAIRRCKRRCKRSAQVMRVRTVIDGYSWGGAAGRKTGTAGRVGTAREPNLEDQGPRKEARLLPRTGVRIASQSLQIRVAPPDQGRTYEECGEPEDRGHEAELNSGREITRGRRLQPLDPVEGVDHPHDGPQESNRRTAAQNDPGDEERAPPPTLAVKVGTELRCLRHQL